MGRLNGKVSILAGGGLSIARAIAIAFAKEGSKVVIAAQHEREGEKIVQMITEQGGEATFIKTDLTNSLDVENMIQATVDFYGKLSVIVNNGSDDQLEPPEICNLSEEVWDRIIDTNLKRVYLCCKYGLRVMKKAKEGVIVNISSIEGLIKSNQPAFSASQGGIIQLTKGIAATMGKYNIRANVICPGTIETPAQRLDYCDYGFQTRDRVKHLNQKIVTRVLPRYGVPEDVANCAVYLASDESRYVTAAVFPVDGGTVRIRID